MSCAIVDSGDCNGCAAEDELCELLDAGLSESSDRAAPDDDDDDSSGEVPSSVVSAPCLRWLCELAGAAADVGAARAAWRSVSAHAAAVVDPGRAAGGELGDSHETRLAKYDRGLFTEEEEAEEVDER